MAIAGHPAPVLLRSSSCEPLDVIPGLPLGAFLGAYDPGRVTLAYGDCLILFTDGVTEARREGERRLLEALREFVVEHPGRDRGEDRRSGADERAEPLPRETARERRVAEECGHARPEGAVIDLEVRPGGRDEARGPEAPPVAPAQEGRDGDEQHQGGERVVAALAHVEQPVRVREQQGGRREREVAPPGLPQDHPHEEPDGEERGQRERHTRGERRAAERSDRCARHHELAPRLTGPGRVRPEFVLGDGVGDRSLGVPRSRPHLVEGRRQEVVHRDQVAAVPGERASELEQAPAEHGRGGLVLPERNLPELGEQQERRDGRHEGGRPLRAVGAGLAQMTFVDRCSMG
ncbi:MAG: SpoIIE family protein phosphatase [Myxococcota bacterium]